MAKLEALTRSHRDGELREIASARIQTRWDNLRAVVQRSRAAGGSMAMSTTMPWRTSS